MTHRPKTAAVVDGLLTVGDIALRLQVSQKTVRRWIERVDLVVHRLGRQLRISPSDFQTFLRARRSG